MKHLPPLNGLRAFCLAAHHESFTAAARELNQTHGAVSRAVKQLEDYFGFPLFVRRNRRLFLTEKGKAFAEQAQDFLTELSQACEALRSPAAEKTLAISCEPSVAMRWLMPRLEAYRQGAPDLDIHLSTAGGPVDLAGQGLDLAIRRSDFKWPSDYWVTPLGKEQMVPVCSPDYKAMTAPKDWTRLHSRSRPEAWQDWCDLTDSALPGKGDKAFDHFYFTLQAAIAGLGVAMAPRCLVVDDLAAGLLVPTADFTETTQDYVALSLKDPRSAPALQQFLDWLTTNFQP